MKAGDKFVLSSGHAFCALAVVLEKYKGLNAEELMDEHGTHPNRNTEEEIWVSTGSLGQGVPIAVGMAIANPENDIYIVSSDGEMAEGSCLEALRIAAERRLENIKLGVIANGTSGYKRTDVEWLESIIPQFYPSMIVRTNMFKYPKCLQGIDGHYYKLKKEDYEGMA